MPYDPQAPVGRARVGSLDDRDLRREDGLFGDWLPQPVAAKLGGDALLSGMGEGTEYLINALLPPPLSLLPFFSIAGVVYFARKIALDEEEFTGGLLLSLYTLAYIAFILLVGGDWMEGRVS